MSIMQELDVHHKKLSMPVVPKFHTKFGADDERVLMELEKMMTGTSAEEWKKTISSMHKLPGENESSPPLTPKTIRKLSFMHHHNNVTITSVHCINSNTV